MLETAKPPWKLAIGAIVATTAVLVCAPKPPRQTWKCGTTAGAVTYIHVKFRSATGATAAIAGTYEPLFTQLPATTVDDRARWARLPIREVDALRVVAHLSRQPDIEQAFVAPEI